MYLQEDNPDWRRDSLAYIRIKDDRFVVKIAKLKIETISREAVSAVSPSLYLVSWSRPYEVSGNLLSCEIHIYSIQKTWLGNKLCKLENLG